jgi:hypothetical protein
MRILALTLSLLLTPALVTSQEVRGFPSSPQAQGMTGDPFAATPAAQPSGEGVSTLRYVLTAAGGAAVGAWIGYMASQVVEGDWEDQQGVRRENWAAGGALAGLTLGLTLPISLGGGPGAARPERQRDPRTVLTGEQIRETGSPSVFDAIQSLRPEWLRTRGVGSMRETPRGTGTLSASGQIEIDVDPGIPSIRVYLDDSFLGGVDELRLVSPGMVGDVRFLDTAEATQRWGGGHIHGAIHIRTTVR